MRSLPTGNIPGRAPVSPERLDVLDANVLILAYSSADARSRIEGQELSQRIPAVVRGSYVGLELTDAIALGFPSVLSIEYALDKLTPLLQSAVKAK